MTLTIPVTYKPNEGAGGGGAMFVENTGIVITPPKGVKTFELHVWSGLRGDLGKVEINMTKVNINGKDHEVPNATLTYEDISLLAYDKVRPYLSIVYSSKFMVDGEKAEISGILINDGKAIKVREGLRITAMNTGNA